MTRVAKCNCGALNVEVTGEPEAVVVCHCLDCQRRTGSVFGVGAYYPKECVQIAGEYKTYVRDTSSGGKFSQNFCPTCGTNLFWTSSNRPGPVAIGVAVGAFADPTFPAPVRSVWEQSHHAWVGLPATIQHFARSRVSRPPA